MLVQLTFGEHKHLSTCSACACGGARAKMLLRKLANCSETGSAYCSYHTVHSRVRVLHRLFSIWRKCCGGALRYICFAVGTSTKK